MSALHQIRVLSDGKRGHENQSLGLGEALRRRTGAEIEMVASRDTESLLSKLRRAAAREPAPQLLIAAGHHTHLALLFAGRQLKCPTVLIMKPSLPVSLFDLCLIPRHDLRGDPVGTRVIPTVGALNRVPEAPPRKEAEGLLMLGGPCKHFAWDEAPLLEAVRTVVQKTPGLSWTLGDSRRTPAGLLDKIKALGLSLTLAPHENTTPDWLPTSLRAADTVWVTPDSTSMVYEALTARARVGLLPLPPNNTRLSRSMDQLVAAQTVTPFASWDPGQPLAMPDEPLHETSRCAAEILKRLFPADG